MIQIDIGTTDYCTPKLECNSCQVKPTREAILQAKLNPGGWVLVVDGYAGPDNQVPPERVQGAWKVDANGKITGEFVPNPKYKPFDQFN